MLKSVKKILSIENQNKHHESFFPGLKPLDWYSPSATPPVFVCPSRRNEPGTPREQKPA